jgi:hypothetical protein
VSFIDADFVTLDADLPPPHPVVIDVMTGTNNIKLPAITMDGNSLLVVSFIVF